MNRLQNPNKDHNPSVIIQSITEAVKEANVWNACIPFLLSERPNDNNLKPIDIFSMVNLDPYEKELYFPPKYKPNDPSSWKLLLRDTQREGCKYGNRLVSIGSKDDNE